MVKKNLKVFLLLVFMFINFSFVVEAQNFETIYHREGTIDIYTRARAGTYMRFDSKILEAELGESSYFDVDINQGENTIKINPAEQNVATSLYVVTENGLTYYFRLNEDNSKEGSSVIDIKSKPEIDYNHLIEMVNNRRINIDPSIREKVKFFDTNEKIFKLDTLNLKVIRSVVNKEDGNIIHWIRFKNNTNEKIKIDRESIDMDNENILAIALESENKNYSDNKLELKKGEILDSYIITESNNSSPSNSIELSMDINENNERFELTNIPYKQQDFTIFERESGEYINMSIDNYNR